MTNRIESVDILRGITIVAMIMVNNPGSWGHVYPPLLHAEWHGLTPTDLIFPFFLFIVGISISFAYKNKRNSKSTYQKIIIRTLKLIGLGLFLGWFLPYFPFFKSFESLRFPGVLQRIGVVFFISAVLFLNFKWKSLLVIAITILISYWLLLGILSTLPAIATCISGILIGKILSMTNKRKVSLLFITGMSLLLIGYIWSLWFPLNKAIWSSSFVLVTSGWATVILAGVYYVTDVKSIKFGSIFKYVGMNAITIFFLSGLIAKTFYLTKVGENNNIHSWLYNTFFSFSFLDDKLSSLLYALITISFYLLLGYYLYKKKIFIKV